jgi:hypothetical protein
MSRLFLSLALSFLASGARAQTAPIPLPCDTKTTASGVDAYRVVTPNVLYLNCDNTNLVEFTTTAKLYVITGATRTAVAGVTATVNLFDPGDPWIRLDLSQAGGSTVLEKGKDYQIDLAPDQNATIRVMADVKVAGQQTFIHEELPLAGPFQALTVGFSTKPIAVIKPLNVSTLGSTFDVYSNVALDTFPLGKIKFAEISPVKVKTYHTVEAALVGAPVHCPPPAPCAAPPPQGGNPETFGRMRVELTTDRLRQAKATVAVEGIANLFAETLKAQSDVTLGAVPKTKDDSLLYLKFDHQAGPGSKPGYAIEAKIAPLLGPPMWGSFVWQPALNMDIGAGTVSNVKVNDTIIPSLGVTTLHRFQSRTLEAIRITPAVSFETNKEGNKRNLLYDQDFQFVVGLLESSRLVRAWRNYNALKAQPGNEDLKFSNDFADWGAGLKFFVGSETGGALESQTVKASKSSNTVLVPTYAVARVRPKLSGYFEYKRINLTVSVLPRFLFATEFATRESSDGKTIRLVPESGFKPYGETSLGIGLDASGHVSFTTTYKLGSQPPTYGSTDTVQTGLLIKY